LAALVPTVSAQDFSAPASPGRRTAPLPAPPRAGADGALVSPFRGGTPHRPEGAESQKFVDRDPGDPFQRPARSGRPVGIRLFILEFW
jgi:hypothetical protein